jgi:alpha-L-fucosidase
MHSSGAPSAPAPSPRQLAWHAMEYYGFVHFTVNTFTDQEWGYGDESPEIFAPTDFSAAQIADVAADAGMAGLILTCKHHDGFCLWPSRYTDHSVRHSPWRSGGGDVVRELSHACRERSLQFGVYLSPWDRNHPSYGTPDYLRYYRNQLEELTSEYGELFEVWFDGANGGDGYYGGARETRRIDRRTYYDWETTWEIVRRNQPGAVMFSDAGPDVRWVGNEDGIAGDPCWATITRASLYPGIDEADLAAYAAGRMVDAWASPRDLLNRGDPEGADWLPAECDVSIRPGWFHHPREDSRVRTGENLLDLYLRSVGRGANLLLNLPPDRRGRIPDADVRSLLEFRRLREALFADDLLAQGARITAGNSPVSTLTDGRRDTYWTPEATHGMPDVVIDFRREVEVATVSLREHLPLGQRVRRFALDVDRHGAWVEHAAGPSIGARRLIHGSPIATRRLRLRLIERAAPPALGEIGVYGGSSAARMTL